MGAVPAHLRTFDPAWFDVAAQGPDGCEEAMTAALAWLRARSAWAKANGYPEAEFLRWIQADMQVRRNVWRASQVWRPQELQWRPIPWTPDP